jgi:hypothetical protein
MAGGYFIAWATGSTERLQTVHVFGWSREAPHWVSAIIFGALAVAIGYRAPWHFRFWHLLAITTLVAIGLTFIKLFHD